jgi:NAD(P)H-binding
VVVFGAGGPTGRKLVEHLNTVGRPTRAIVRPGTEWPEQLVASTLRIARVDLSRTANYMRFLEDATHIVFLAGSRPALTATSSRLMVDYGSFMSCLETAQRNHFAGSLIYVGVERRPPVSFGERLQDMRRARWAVYKSASERELAASGLKYLVLRTRMLSDEPIGALRFRLGGQLTADETPRPLPRAALAAFLAGAVIHGHTPRAGVTLVAGRIGYALKQAVAMLRDLKPERVDPRDPDFHPDKAWQAARRTADADEFER